MQIDPSTVDAGQTLVSAIISLVMAIFGFVAAKKGSKK